MSHAPMLWPLAIGLLLSGAWLLYVGATVSKHGAVTEVEENYCAV